MRIVDDDLGYAWLHLAGPPPRASPTCSIPGETAVLGDQRRRRREDLPASYDYDEALPADYWEPAARVEHLDAMGLDDAVLFPNFGLLWERRLSGVAAGPHGQHGRVEPLVRDRRPQTEQAGSTRSRT